MKWIFFRKKQVHPDALLSPTERPPDKDRAVHLAVLDALYPTFGGCPSTADVRKPEDLPLEVETFWRSKIAGCRMWSQSVEDTLVKKHYLSWMDYYEHKLNDAVEERDFGYWQKRMMEYERASAEDDRLRNSVTIPIFK